MSVLHIGAGTVGLLLIAIAVVAFSAYLKGLAAASPSGKHLWGVDA